MAGDIKTLKETSDYIVSAGKKRLEKSTLTLILQGMLAGIFIGFGAIAYYKLASLAADPGLGAFLGSAIFPVGIIAILMLGSELFTSNTMMMMGVYNKQYRMHKVLKVLAIVLFANLLGMVVISALSSFSGIFTQAMTEKIIHAAEAKTSMSVTNLIVSAILCNMIVCTGVWAAYAMKHAGVKILVLWMVITVFALSGTEHVVANAYYMFTAYMLGADITFAGIGYNLLYVTIGNFIGGAVVITGINKLIISKNRITVRTKSPYTRRQRNAIYAKAYGGVTENVVTYKEDESKSKEK